MHQSWASIETARWAIRRASDEGIAGNLTSAVDWMEVAIGLNPANINALAFLAALRRAMTDPREADTWQQMADADPAAAKQGQDVLDRVDRFLDTRHLSTADSIGVSDMARPSLLWLLGYVLKKDASPRRRLIRRLNTMVRLAARFPDVPMLLSGGTRSNRPRTEAAVMAGYLVEHGVNPDRLLTEDCSQETLENIVFARRFLSKRPDVCLVSEDPHLSRAGAILDRTGWVKEVALVTAQKSAPLSATDKAGAYRDCLRLAGFPLYDQRAVDMVWIPDVAPASPIRR